MTGRIAGPLRRLVVGVGPQFTRFGVVGTLGFVVDTATVYLLRGPLGIYAAGFASAGVASVVTWRLNRRWTFRGRGTGAAHRQALLYFAMILVGLAVNRTAFVLAVMFVPVCQRAPVLAVAAGAVAGMLVNFNLVRSVVFRAHVPPL